MKGATGGHAPADAAGRVPASRACLTLGNLFCGFYALIAVYNDEYLAAAIAILLAEVFDCLDGGVARMTGATSDIGIQLDSLADLVSFGVAPGLLAYVFALKPFGWIGGLAAFAFAACGAFRLARFNVQTARPGQALLRRPAHPGGGRGGGHVRAVHEGVLGGGRLRAGAGVRPMRLPPESCSGCTGWGS